MTSTTLDRDTAPLVPPPPEDPDLLVALRPLLDEEDCVSNHRGHGHFLARSCPMCMSRMFWHEPGGADRLPGERAAR